MSDERKWDALISDLGTVHQALVDWATDHRDDGMSFDDFFDKLEEVVTLSGRLRSEIDKGEV